MAIVCYHCFNRVEKTDIYFQCDWSHGESREPFRFPANLTSGFGRVPDTAACPLDGAFTNSKVCPHCRGRLPYYAGHIKQRIIAIAGCRAAGKSVYLTALLYQLRERVSREVVVPYAVMFEDDDSYAQYRELYQTLIVDGKLLYATDDRDQRRGEGFEPLVVRLLSRARGRKKKLQNLVFFDPAGELFLSMKDIRFIRYLSHASSLLYLVDSDAGTGSIEDAAVGLNNIATSLRNRMGRSRGKLRHSLAVVLTQCDKSVFNNGGREAVLPANSSGQRFWAQRSGKIESALQGTSGRCRALLQRRPSLIAAAENNFRRVYYFAVGVDGLRQPFPIPIAVEDPLFWLLRSES